MSRQDEGTLIVDMGSLTEFVGEFVGWRWGNRRDAPHRLHKATLFPFSQK